MVEDHNGHRQIGRRDQHKDKKLFTWKQWVVLVPACLLGLALFLYRSYIENGIISTVDWIAACSAAVLILVIFVVMSWWGNKPEK